MVTAMLNKLTTNYTYFLREEAHFKYLWDVVLPDLQKKHARDKCLSIWSAGCSTPIFPRTLYWRRGSRRLDFVTKVNWKELHRLLKVSFPVAVQAEEGINEIQFGYVTRPTHRSRQYDKDRFEVCNQRYSACATKAMARRCSTL